MNVNDTTQFIRTVGERIWKQAEDAKRAELYGDGIFETMVYVGGNIRFSDAHQDRVTSGLSVLKMDPKGLSSLADVETLLAETAPAGQPLRVRWTVFRSGKGKYTPLENTCSERLLIQPFAPAPLIKETAYISTSIHLHAFPWSQCKTLNCLPYVMANIERMEKNMDEVILTDAQGYLSEAGASNLFWVKAGVFYTPSLIHHAIAGVGRRKIIQLLGSKNIPVHEGTFTKKELLDADQVFTSNVTGISYIKYIENRRFSTNSIALIEELFSPSSTGYH